MAIFRPDGQIPQAYGAPRAPASNWSRKPVRRVAPVKPKVSKGVKPVAAKPAAPAAPATPAPVQYGGPQQWQIPLDQWKTLDPESANYFVTNLGRLNQTHDLGVNQVGYDRGNAQLNYAAQTQQANQKWDRNYQKLPGVWVRRGIANSGIANQGYSDFTTDRVNAFGNMDRAYQQQLQGYGNQISQLDLVRQQAEDDLSNQARARIAALASLINGGSQ